MKLFPRLSYSLTSDYPWPWLTPIMAFLSILSLGILIPLNCGFTSKTCTDDTTLISYNFYISDALTGYQIISVQSPDYNSTESWWFTKFVPHAYRPKPGTRCAPHLYSVGDAFVTNYTIFNWAIQNILHSTEDSAGHAGVAYKGITLDSCDVVTIGMQANLQTRMVSFAAGIWCLDDGFPVAASTFFTVGDLAASTAAFNNELRQSASWNGVDSFFPVVEV